MSTQKPLKVPLNARFSYFYTLPEAFLLLFGHLTAVPPQSPCRVLAQSVPQESLPHSPLPAPFYTALASSVFLT